MGKYNASKIYYILLLMYAAIVVFPKGLHYWVVALLALNYIFGGNFRSKYLLLTKSPFFIICTAFALLSLLGLIYTSNLEKGLEQIDRRLVALLLPLIICSSPLLTSRQLKRILQVFAFTIFATVWIFFWLALPRVHQEFGIFFPQDLGYFPYRDQLIEILEIHPTFMSLYLAFAFFIFFYLLSKDSPKLTIKIIYLLGMVSMIYFMNLFVSRIVLISFSLILFVWLFLMTKRWQYKIAVVVLLLFIGLFVSLAFPDVVYRFQETVQTDYTAPVGNTQNSTNLRIAHWQCSWEVIKDNWLIGVAPGDAQDHLNLCYQQHGYSKALWERRFNAHNQMLQSWMGSGLIGLALLLAIFSYPLYISLIRKHTLLIVLLGLYGAAAFTDSIFERQKGITFFFFFVPLLLAHLKKGVRPVFQKMENISSFLD